MESDSSVLSDSTASRGQQGRKRLRRVEQWARKKRKVKKDSGKGCSVPKQRRPRSGTKVTRSNSFQYHVRLSSGNYEVCKQAFYQINAIGKCRVEHLCSIWCSVFWG